MINLGSDFNSPCLTDNRKQGCVDVLGRGLCTFKACSYLEFICIVEADLHRWNHPGLEQRTQDSICYCVSDKMKVERISPEK